MNDMDNRQTLRKQVDQYLKGELTTSEADRFWAGVLRYPELLDEMEAEAAARLLIQSAREGKTAPKRESVSGTGTLGKSIPGTRVSPLHWIVAMTVVVVLVTGLVLWKSQTEDTIPNRIELTEMIAPDIYRDSQRGYDEEDVLINEGLAQALREKTQDAIEIYRDLLARELTSSQEDAVRINLAILYFNTGAFEKAQSELNRLLESSRLDRPERLSGKVWWMLGVNQVKLGKPESAIHSFSEALKFEQIHDEQIREWSRSLR
ncbi:MAG: tetratricopeptide repeat protein [Balneolaceae bacterium]